MARFPGVVMVALMLGGCAGGGSDAADAAVEVQAADPGPETEALAEVAATDDGAVDVLPDEAAAETPGELPDDVVATDAPTDADAPPPVEGPSATGTFAVLHVDNLTVDGAGGRKVTITVCEPSLDGGTTVAAGPFPLVVLSPGFSLDKSNYDSYCRHLASWGFLAVIQNYSESAFDLKHADLAADAVALIDWVASDASGLKDRLDATRIATAGHSLGGKVSLLAATLDPRIKVVVGWDPVIAGAPGAAQDPTPVVDVPLAVLGETTDSTVGPYGQACAPAGANFQTVYDAAKPPALKITVAGANHMVWLDDTDCGLACMVCNAATADPAWVHLLTRRTTVAFLRKHLLDDASMDPYLAGAAMQADVDAGRITVDAK